jgi:hypothetical protein
VPPFQTPCSWSCSAQRIYPAVSDSRCATVTSFSLRVLIHFTLKSHVPRSELLSDWDLIREHSKEVPPNPEPALIPGPRSLTIRHLCAGERRGGREVQAKVQGRAQRYHFSTHWCSQGSETTPSASTQAISFNPRPNSMQQPNWTEYPNLTHASPSLHQRGRACVWQAMIDLSVPQALSFLLLLPAMFRPWQTRQVERQGEKEKEPERRWETWQKHLTQLSYSYLCSCKDGWIRDLCHKNPHPFRVTSDFLTWSAEVQMLSAASFFYDKRQWHVFLATEL